MKPEVLKIFQNYLPFFSGDLAVGWMDLSSGERCCINENRLLPTASVYKIFILAGILRKIEEGSLQWTDKIKVTKKLLAPGSGILKLFSGGEDISISDCIYLMISISDNTAADILFSICGEKEIDEKVLRSNSLLHTKCRTSCRDMVMSFYGIDEYAGEFDKDSYKTINPIQKDVHGYNASYYDNYTTISDILNFFQKVYNGQFISPWISKEIIQVLSQCETNTRIPYYLPPEVVVSHKTGTMGRLVNDVGIIFAPKGDFILAFLYNGNNANHEEQGKNIKGHQSELYMAEISKRIYSLYA